MKRAQDYLLKLAEGTDPISGSELPEDTTLNNVRLSRCFYYVADILAKVIDNGGEVGSQKRVRKDPFVMTKEELKNMAPSEMPVTISQFCERIHMKLGRENMRTLPTKVLTDWLAGKALINTETVNGRMRRRPSSTAGAVGITEETRQGQYGEFLAVLYDKKAQQFILDHLEEITPESIDKGGSEA